MLFSEFGNKENPPILLLHGMMQDWHNEYQLLKPLEEHYRLIIPAPEEVEADMQALLDSYNSKDSHELRDLAELHARFEQIHPFQDGNGRTGRMILFKECLRSHIMPFIIGDERKAEYYECLNNAQIKSDYEPLIRFFGEEQVRYSDMVMDFICPVSKEKSAERKQDRER